MVHARTKVLVRRREVTSLLVRGVPPGEIAEMLKTPKHTIYNDVRVIRSGKNDALFAHARNEIVAQLYLNAQERARYLWRVIEEADKYYVKVQALRELRLNDEQITNKLPEPKMDPLAPEGEEVDMVAMLEQYQELQERVDQMQKRRLGMQHMVKKKLECGDMEGLKLWLDNYKEQPAG